MKKKYKIISDGGQKWPESHYINMDEHSKISPSQLYQTDQKGSCKCQEHLHLVCNIGTEWIDWSLS